MALSYLGETLDIHGGGQDLIFPHHENETAQSEAYTGKEPFTRHWVHNGLLHMGHDKMSKSLGNLVSLQESLRRYSPDTLRIFFLSSHYRSPLTYNDTGLPSTDRLRNALRHDGANGGEVLDPAPFKTRFLEAMDADLNTPAGTGRPLRPGPGHQPGQRVRAWTSATPRMPSGPSGASWG